MNRANTKSTEWEAIFASYTSNRELIFRIYKKKFFKVKHKDLDQGTGLSTTTTRRQP